MPYLRLLGGARIDADADQIPVRGRAAHRRRLALLALLTASPGHRLSRERIIAYLWADRGSDIGRRHLSEALHVVRRELGETAIVSVADDVRLDTAAIGSDLVDFRLALADQDHERAVALYGGAFLDGWFVEGAPEFEEWAEAERAAIQAVYLSALEMLADQAEALADWATAVERWRSITRLVRDASRPTVRFARALTAHGDRTAAIRALEAHLTLLEQDELPADPLVASLHASLRRGEQPWPDLPTGTQQPPKATPVEGPVPLQEPSPSLPEVELTEVEAPSAIPALEAQPRRRHSWLAALVVVLMALGLTGWWQLGRSNTSQLPLAATPANQRIAVLYLTHSGRDDIGYLADAITGRLIDELSSVSGLQVVSRTGVLPFRNRTESISLDSIAHRLRVGLLVEGSVEQTPDRVRVTISLVDATTGLRIGAPRRIERNAGRDVIFTVQDEVAATLAMMVRRQLGMSESTLLASREGTSSATAQEFADRAAYLRTSAWALGQYGQSSDIPSARKMLAEADSLFALAERADPTWPAPTVARGWIARDRFRLASPDSQRDWLLTATRHGDRALALDDDNATARELRGTVRWHLASGDTSLIARDSAINDLRRAIQRDSTRVIAMAMLSQLLRVTGTSDDDRREAIRLARHAYERDLYLASAEGVLVQLYRGYYALNELDSARTWCDRGREVLPGDWRWVDCALVLMRADLKRASVTEAWRTVAELDQLDPPARASQSDRAYLTIYRRLVAAAVSAIHGQRDSARVVLARALRDVSGDADMHFDIKHDEALVRFALGERAEALAALRSYLQFRPQYFEAVVNDRAWRQFGFDSGTLERALRVRAPE
jgi:DNA-binding SARP family transcriptional activator/TolB-like protein/tetratricopeptide (TPR) repeat protein